MSESIGLHPIAFSGGMGAIPERIPMRFNRVEVRVDRRPDMDAIIAFGRLPLPGAARYVECSQMISGELLSQANSSTETAIAEEVSRALARGLANAFMNHAANGDDVSLRGYDARMVYEELLENIRAQMFRNGLGYMSAAEARRLAWETERQRRRMEMMVAPSMMIGGADFGNIDMSPGAVTYGRSPASEGLTIAHLRAAQMRLAQANEAHHMTATEVLARQAARFLDNEILSAFGVPGEFFKKEKKLKEYKAPRFKLSEAPIIKEVIPGLMSIPKEDLEERVLQVIGEK